MGSRARSAPLVGGLISGLCISYVGGYLGSGLEPLGALALLMVALMARPEGHLRPAAGPEGVRWTGAAIDIARRLHVPRQPLRAPSARSPLSSPAAPCSTSSRLRLSSYNDYQVGEIALYVVALVGLSLLTGVNGQISLGHGAFMAVGAYTMALAHEPHRVQLHPRAPGRRGVGGGSGARHRPAGHPA